MVKLKRAYSGCLGKTWRRRAWQAAISSGEAHAAVEPEIPEWDFPSYSLTEGEPPELKHLSKGRKRKQHAIPSVEAIEDGRGQTESRCESGGGCGLWARLSAVATEAEMDWNVLPERVKAP